MNPARSGWSPPERFDDFELLGPLGRGGMGHVHLAKEVSLDREVAIKFIGAEEPDPAAVRRFEREARAIARLSHENVVQVYRVGSVEGRPYLAYEFVRGQTLEAHREPLQWENVLTIALGLSRGLAAVHEAGIVHRDIKPANVMVHEEGQVKLLDFGLALGGLGPAETPSGGRTPEPLQTREGAIAGTPAFMAPELFMGRPASFPSDVFATGLVLYDLLTGRRDRYGLSLPALAAKMQEGFAPLASSVSDVPKALSRVIDRCLRVVPYERPESGLKLREELEPLGTVLLSRSRSGFVEAPDSRLVADSLARVWPELDGFTARLYERLFDERPRYRRLFPPDLRDQRVKLGHALRLAIEGLRTPERLRGSLQDLGRQHRGFGVTPDDLTALGPYLMSTLREFEKEAWTPELEAAWSSAWVFILTAMQSGYGVSQDTLVASTRLGLAQTPSETPPAPAVPETQYLETPETLLAYQTYGSGPHPLLVLPGFLCHLELAWKGEASARFLRELGTQGEVLVFDRRGSGLTDRSGGVGSLEEQARDALALLDAQGIDSAVIFASDHAVPVALALLAEHPQRFRGAVLHAGHAKLVDEGDFVAGLAPEEFAHLEELFTRAWGQRELIQFLAPSRAEDPEFCAWLGDFMRGSANPREALRALRAAAAVDVRDVLDRIDAPVLLLHPKEDRFAPRRASHYLAARLQRASLVELEGADHLASVGDAELLLFEIFRFLSSLELDSR